MKARDVFKLVGAAALVAMAILALPAAASAEPPAVTIDPVGSSSLVTAEVSGEVDANEIFTEWFFEVAAEENGSWGEWSRTNLAGYSEAADPEAVGGTIEGLKAGTKYQVRLGAYNFEEFVAYYSAEPNPEFSTEPAVPPSLTLGPAENVGSHSAHLSGTVDPEGGNEDAQAGVLPIVWELQTNLEGSGWSTAASGELTGSEAQATTAIPVEADLTGLTANAEYTFRLQARYAGREAETGEGSFTTGALAPTITESTLWEPKQTSIQLNAFVNAHHDVLTDCHFEYGTGGSLDQTASCEAPTLDGTYSPPSREGDELVSARISGLTPGAEYSFRLIAVNGGGSTEGDVHAFETLRPAPPQGVCPNEAVRIQQHATALPNCRAYEMVSPPDKNNGEISADGDMDVAAADGDAVAFDSRTPFGDTVGSGVSGHTQYVARRSNDGWSTHSIDPTPNPLANQTFFSHSVIPYFSEDLTTGLAWAYDLPSVEGDTPDRMNIYLENTAAGGFTPLTVSHLEPPAPFSVRDFTEPSESFAGLSADASHVLFASRVQLLPAAEPGVENIYEWSNGELRLVDRVPGTETAPPGGAEPASGSWTYRQNLSRDGTRALFLTAADQQLYQRIEGGRTVWISEPETSEAPSELAPVTLQAATPDGRNVFFITNSPLVDEDTNNGPDLYRWRDTPNPEQEKNLTLVSNSGEVRPTTGTERAVIGVSDDGDRIYYHTPRDQVILWEHGTVRATLNEIQSSPEVREGISAIVSRAPSLGRVSPDGRWLAFVTKYSFENDGLHALTGQGMSKKSQELYLYDSRNNTLSCVSCSAFNDVAASVYPRLSSSNTVAYYLDGVQPHFLADDGTLFFSTNEALSPVDVNGASDAYQYDPAIGKPELLSTGRGAGGSAFADASINGSDVFILNRQRLVSSDRDDLIDMYDVRVGGGFAEPEAVATECGAEVCRGTPASPPPASSDLASNAISRGNVQRRRCHRGRHCRRHKRHHHKHRRHRGGADNRSADKNRRAAK